MEQHSFMPQEVGFTPEVSRSAHEASFEARRADLARRRAELEKQLQALQAEEADLSHQEVALAEKSAFTDLEKKWFARGDDERLMELQMRWQETGSLSGEGEDDIPDSDKLRFIEARLAEMPSDGASIGERNRLEMLRRQYSPR